MNRPGGGPASGAGGGPAARGTSGAEPGGPGGRPLVDVVVPTLGRPSLSLLLDALARTEQAAPGTSVLGHVYLVDDRPGGRGRLAVDGMADVLAGRVHVLAGPGTGPAAARNAGWRRSGAPWVAFLDDDVVPSPTWAADLGTDLVGLALDVAASQGRIRVPLPEDRRPTDWERNVAGLAQARWITADLACRVAALDAVGGFDERFPRAYREDADLAVRLMRGGWRLEQGRRQTTHPVGPSRPWVSVSRQAGNADDALMAALHGRGWRREVGAPGGRLRRHLAVTLAGAGALVGLATGRRAAAIAGAGAWMVGTGELAWARIAPGPRTRREAATMVLTSAVLPAAAVAHRVAGTVRAQRLRGSDRAWVRHGSAGGPGSAGGHGPSVDGAGGARRPPPAAVLFDRDGTLVRDVPYNGDPELVEPMPGARAALDRLRDAGIPVAVVSNQSGVARGVLGRDQVDAVNRRVEEMVGPVAAWMVCPHGPEDGCPCRKPAPGLILAAAANLRVEAAEVAVVGDIGSDVEAALAAGARPILVPTPATRPQEVRAAPEVAGDLAAAVDLLVGKP